MTPSDQRRAQNAAYYAAHREEAKEKARAYYRANRDACLKTQLAWRETHREQAIAATTEWGQLNKEKKRLQYQRYYERHKGDVRSYREEHAAERRSYQQVYGPIYRNEHPDAVRASSRNWARTHPEARRMALPRRRERLAQVGDYVRMDPWPTDCQVCHALLDPNLHGLVPIASSLGHEPPIRWASDHPEYTGPYVIRPEHLSCNARKGTRPDWEM